MKRFLACDRWTNARPGAVKGLAMLVLACLAAAGIGISQRVLANRAQDIDSDTLCRRSSVPDSHWVVMIDHTDPFTASQGDLIKRTFGELKAEIPRDGRVSVFIIDAASDPLREPVLSLCSPGAGKDASEWTENRRRMQRKFDSKFGMQLDALAAQLSTGGTAPRSPIVEALRDVSSRADFGASVPDRRLIVVSDMLQNSAMLSHYRRNATDVDYRRLPSGMNMPDLAGVDVQVHYLLRIRDAAYQSPRHTHWWAAYFALLDVKRLDWRRH